MTTSPNLRLVTETPEPPTTDGLDFAQAHFLVAAHAVIDDYMDVRVRGHLKDHPDVVAYRLSELQHVIDNVRQVVDRERAAGKWGEAIGVLDAAGDLRDATEWFLGHRCDCDHCIRGGTTRPVCPLHDDADAPAGPCSCDS
ncbi:hypothetical protein HW846_46530 [Streptomyces sp. NE06-02F]|nr:hypothetical protein [Streptomyces caniscabiei]MBE4790704.1 hypothetical protein [Streptomyces caniscabiei]MDX2947908.1 hypothetical protein [Streptomyces caniscabiei]